MWAVMRRTWRCPSTILISSQQVGISLRLAHGGLRGHTRRVIHDARALAGRVMPSLSSTPARRAASFSSLGMPSTCTQ